MTAGLERRVSALEAQFGRRSDRPYAHLTDRELSQLILRLDLRREPTDEEIAADMALSVEEVKSRLAAVRAELERP